MHSTTHRLFCLTLLSLASLLPISLQAMHAYNVANEHMRINKIAPRLQWNENQGYCGEVSLISAGLYFGQYVSQYTARAIACKGAPQEACQLLLGVNAHYAATQMHLESQEWPSFQNDSTDDFLSWIKAHVLNGSPVAIGIYMNQFRFYRNTQPTAGDPQYDHIVPITGIGSNYPLTPTYHADDLIYFSDNGLWGESYNPHYKFSYRFNTFQGTRQQANSKQGPIYSVPNEGHNYGIAILGVFDRDHDTVRVRLETSPNFEFPNILNGSNKRPASMPLKLTVTAIDLEPNVPYNLYLYNSFETVPTYAFNANGSQATQMWQIQIPSGTSSYIMTHAISSDETAIFRCVRADAP